MRVALYARVSTEEQALHGLSIEAQTAALDAWAKDHTIVDHYVDRGISARIPIKKRPELQRLLRDVEQGRIDLVVFTKLDRWTRNIREYYKAQDVLDAHNVAWKALQEDYETQTAAGRLKVNIMLAVAQDEADRTSERVKAVFEEKRRKGLVVNGNMPLGLTVVDGHLSPSADAGKIKEAFRFYIASRSVYALAVKSKEILGRPYTSPGIRSMLQNQRYLDAGVISLGEWEQAQQILSVRAVRRSRTDRVYLFSGLMLCPECGGRMTARCCKKGETEYVYYNCGRAHKSGQCSYRTMIREESVEDFCKKRLLKEIAGYNLKVRKAQKKPVDVAALQRKLDRLTDLYTDGLIGRDEYNERSSPVRDALRTAQTETKEKNPWEVMTVLDAYDSLSRFAKKAFWSQVLQSVTPSEDGFILALGLLSV